MRAELDRLASSILDCYPSVAGSRTIHSLANHGGFSGALLWRIEAGGLLFCLRAWPSRQSDATRLEFVHKLMRRARSGGLEFVASVIATSDGLGHISHAGRLWDLTEWLPGRADYHATPSAARLEAAARALARLHVAWEGLVHTPPAVCPALRRRLAAVLDWQELRRNGWRQLTETGHFDPVQPVAERAWQLIDGCVADVPKRLQPWSEWQCTLQPCLCDVWHDHLLFEGDRLTGLVDFGSAKIDHPSVDLARMLGSLVPDNLAAWQTGLRAYRALRPFSDAEAELARALDETGSVIGVATWLRWLYEEQRPFDDRDAVARRLSLLVDRLESLRGKSSPGG
jgi:Ser/Thr protein kinase RdoA (MazF antagonist)